MNNVVRMPEVNTTVTPMEMLDRALQSNANPETLAKLMELQERWERNQARKSFDAAMASAKAEMPIIIKNREVDFSSAKGRTNYRHEDLAEVVRTITPVLGRFGLSHRFRATSNVNEPVTVTCIISHRDGHFEENTLCAGRDDSGNKNSIQQIGSTITYLQRMTLKAALGLAASEDDDGSKSGEIEQDYINSDQLAKLVALAEEVGADKAKFCKYLKVGSLAEIPASNFAHAVSLLEAKRGAK